ncbi:MAG: transcriptional repressor NrdR [Clostridia bacterium]|nr:transcriptional repressor NrdR [Clostridia bacterium]MBQ8862143.1 transcriptional repressor NrdR [Clostridia bacterium]
MKCPKCGYSKSIVVDSRPAEEGASIRRRRECLSCQNRFTTYETVETLPLLVIKKDKTRQTFDKNKLLNGIIQACHKRPIPLEQMENIVNEIELELQNSLTHEVPSSKIGVLVMEKLKQLDDVAYVRFASVYREFKDLDTFMQELEGLKSQKNEKQGVQ